MLRAKDSATILPGLSDEDNSLMVFGGAAVGAAIELRLGEEPGSNRKRIDFHLIGEGERFEAGGLAFTPLCANHMRTETCYVYIVDDGRSSMLYANDTGALPEETYRLMAQFPRPFDVVSMDCARGTLPGDGHMGIKENKEMVDRLMAMGKVDRHTRLYLNHFSHMCGLIHDDLQKLVEPDGLIVTYDGLGIEVGRA
jgi:phosphoribosyl 1,2-cyclic phosphate phosphodiesterase